MNESFSSWFLVHKINWKKLVFAFFLLVFALILYNLSGDYVTDTAKTVVAPDLILDNIGPYNLNFIFVWLIIAVISFYFIYPLIAKPKEMPYVINMFSMFIIIRSFFVIFTHLGVPYDATVTQFPSILQFLNFSNDLFFSGHTGLPFLGFLIFRKHHRGLSYFMLASSIVLAITVLLMHVHYSIDVFSAYFITYGIYKIGNLFLKEAKQDNIGE